MQPHDGFNLEDQHDFKHELSTNIWDLPASGGGFDRSQLVNCDAKAVGD